MAMYFDVTPYLVKLVMKGLKSQLGDQRVQMQPLTADQLRNMYAMAILTPDDVTIWGAVILSFRSLLRKSNIVPDGETNLRHVLRRRDVELQEWGVMIRVHSSKALQFKQYVLEIPIYYDSHPIFCVASALQRHLRRFLVYWKTRCSLNRNRERGYLCCIRSYLPF